MSDFTHDVKIFSALNERTRLHVSNGNSKLGKGIYTINTMPGDAPLTLKNGTVLTNVPGTCGGCCSGCKSACYAINDAKRYHTSVIPALADNTLLARHEPDRFFSEIDRFLRFNVVSVIRLHSAGEFMSYDYFARWIDFAAAHPDVIIYSYTKRFEYVERFLATGAAFPANFVLNMSIWHGNYSNPHGLPEFIYDDGTDASLTSVPHCPLTRTAIRPVLPVLSAAAALQPSLASVPRFTPTNSSAITARPAAD